LATASLDSTVRVWRVSDGSCLQTLEGPGDGVEWLTWHPKGEWDWQTTTGRLAQCIALDDNYYTMVADYLQHELLQITHLQLDCTSTFCACLLLTKHKSTAALNPAKHK